MASLKIIFLLSFQVSSFKLQTCSGEVGIIYDMWRDWTEETDFVGRRKSYRR